MQEMVREIRFDPTGEILREGPGERDGRGGGGLKMGLMH